MLTGDSFHGFFHCGWLFYPNADNISIGSLYFRECSILWTIIIWLRYLGHVMMLTIISNYIDWIKPCWKSYCIFKDIVFNERVIRWINFYCWESFCVYAIQRIGTRGQNFSKIIVIPVNFSDEQYLSFLVCGYHHFIVDLMLVQPINYPFYIMLYIFLGFGLGTFKITSKMRWGGVQRAVDFVSVEFSRCFSCREKIIFVLITV